MNQSQQPSTSLSNQSSNPPTHDAVVSIVHHTNSEATDSNKSITLKNDELVAIVEYPPSLDDYDIIGNDPPDVPIEKQWLEQLLSPWGMGSLLILLLANILLSWAQWSTEKQPANVTSQSNQTSDQLSLSQPANVTRRHSEKLSLDRLSVIPVSEKSPKNKSKSPNKAARATIKPAASVVPKSKSATNLTNALLPPSLQPQLVQTYPASGIPPRPPLSQALPVNPPSQPPSAHSSTQKTSGQPPSASATSNPDKKLLLDQERVFEQIRVREQQPAPLGFNTKYQAELRARKNKQNPSEVIQQLQQEQQQRIEQTNTPNPIATDKPAQ